MARGGVKDDVLSEKRADPLCRDHPDGFDRDSTDSGDHDYSHQCSSIEGCQCHYAVYDSVASCLWTFYLGEDTGGRSDLWQHVLAAGRNELGCFSLGHASRESDGYGRYTGLQIETDYN